MRASAGDQRRIDLVCYFQSPVEQSLLLLQLLSEQAVEATALLRTKEQQRYPNLHIWICKPFHTDYCTSEEPLHNIDLVLMNLKLKR